jgi:16S rRNA (uracil1498-N3)-methyltransferase
VAAAHAFVDDLDAPVLGDDDRRHLERVLRLRDGEVVTVSDGRGAVRRCRFTSGGDLRPDGEVEHSEAASPALTIAFAVPKGDRLEWAVQKLTEVGVDRIVVLETGRSVVRWDDDGRAARRLGRIRRVAREAAMQSRRVWLPSVDGPVPFAQAAAWPGACVADAAGDPPTLASPAVLVGPEGGWTDQEEAAALPRVAVGDGVLRTETAAVAAGVLLAAFRAGLAGPCRE